MTFGPVGVPGGVLKGVPGTTFGTIFWKLQFLMSLSSNLFPVEPRWTNLGIKKKLGPVVVPGGVLKGLPGTTFGTIFWRLKFLMISSPKLTANEPRWNNLGIERTLGLLGVPGGVLKGVPGTTFGTIFWKLRFLMILSSKLVANEPRWINLNKFGH